MSYALETKKRKFDRILESLTDGAASQSRSSLNSRNNVSITSISTDGASDISKRRRVTPSSTLTASKTLSTASLTGHYLPSSRAAFLERLETFRHVTKWHVPSTESINASVWAKSGWSCVDTDTVFCGSCKEKLTIDLELDTPKDPNIDGASESRGDEHVPENQEDNDDSFVVAKEVYDGLVKRYQDMVVMAHTESCPWRKRGCDGSIQRIEGLLNSWNAISGLQARYDSIVSSPEELPGVAELPQATTVNEQELMRLQFDGKDNLSIEALKMALCGWQRKCEDVIECRNCFRSLGLWLYRGHDPTMEQLDVVESHLEYCPWRSAIAQDTEISVSSHRDNESVHTTEKVAGWVLVYKAVVKDNNKKRSTAASSINTLSDTQPTVTDSEPITPEQREKKMKDLMRRIKELKKPFNVKALLRKKEKPKA